MIQVNLLAWREESKKIQKKQFSYVLGGILGFALIVILIRFYLLGNILNRQNVRNSVFQQEVTMADAKLADYQSVPDKNVKLSQELSRLIKLNNYKFQLINLLNELAVKLPDGIYLTQIAFRNGVVVLAGESPDDTKVSLLIKNLAALSYTQNVKLNEITDPKDKIEIDKQFIVQFEFKE